MKPPVVVFTNQKGGVGKTTLTRELGICFAGAGKRVLLVDLDPQGNLSKSLVTTELGGLYEALEESVVTPVMIRPNLWLLAGDLRLASLEKRYLGEVDAYARLGLVLASVDLELDLILLDAPPSLGMMTINALAAASHFVIPLRPAFYSLQGTNDLFASISKVKKTLNSGLEFLGVVVNDYLIGPVVSRKIKEEVFETFEDKVFGQTISRSIKIEEAIAVQQGLIEIEGSEKLAEEVRSLAGQVLNRLGV